eukprot:TRINITY_DN29862_c0_g1_i1.p1 TRINITY_DN29862_c0_g1~~TRINITY_DN29862_c0_g1_i1.p1  ORF type:complete len:691 (+),score=186.23 TRINITY_DN29862_c0_g1_i1:68-2140(+)
MLALWAVAAAAAQEVKLQPWGDNSIRIRVSCPGKPVTEPLSPALLPQPPSAATAATDAVLRDGAWVQSNGNLRVSVDAQTYLATVTRVSDGAVLLRQTNLTFNPPQVSGVRSGFEEITASFEGLAAGETVTGFGEHGRGPGGRGVRRTHWTKSFADSINYGKSNGGDVSVPWYASSRGYGFIWNLPALGRVSVGADGITWTAMAAGGLDFWVTTTPRNTTGSPYPDLLRQYAQGVGFPSKLPAWGTGFIQCKDRYRNQSQLLDVAHGYKSRGLPISMIVIDWFHWVQMGDFGLNPVCWPDPQKMVDELRGLGIELMITFWPYMGRNVSRNWKEYSSKGYLAVNLTSGGQDSCWKGGPAPTGNSLIDSTNPAAMEATFNHWFEGYGKYGVRSVWLDQTEPDCQDYISGGQWRMQLGSDAELLPAWVKHWVGSFKDGMAKMGKKPGDYFILARSAWAGTAAYGAALWSGDIASTWEEFATAVTIGQGVGMSGIPHWTTDIGGYHGGDPSSPDFQQLIVRWFQFGAFCPLFRLHGHREGGPKGDECGETNGDNEVWNLAKEPAHYDAIVAVMKLRESIRGEVASLSEEAAATGMPIMRPMFLEFPGCDVCTAVPEAAGIDAQYMFGSDWLVAPVTAANATMWPVYLPALPDGQEWVYWWNSTTVAHDGGRWVSVDTRSIADFPLFRRTTAAQK